MKEKYCNLLNKVGIKVMALKRCVLKISQTIENGHKMFRNVHANVHERLGTFKSMGINALERIIAQLSSHILISVLNLDSKTDQ
jgi:hypothetical protein